MLGAIDYYMITDDNINPFCRARYRNHVFTSEYRYELPIPLKKMPGILPSGPKSVYCLKLLQALASPLTPKYYYGFKAGDLPAQGYFTINVGFVFVTIK